MNWKSTQLKDEAFSSSSDFNTHHAAKLCRLNSDEGKANWSAKKNDKHQWLQINLGTIQIIEAVAVQGRHNNDQWVTKYHLLISNDKLNWEKFENIEGANDRSTVSIFKLPIPVSGQYIRFLPTEWHGHISMRVDVATYKNEIKWVIQNLPDIALSSSSDFNKDHASNLCRLNSSSGTANWSAKKNDNNQWLQVDLGKIEPISGVAVQGRFNHDQWVKKYDLQISSDLKSWEIVENIPGCNDKNTVNEFMLEKIILGRYVRFIPKEWHKHISMRVDIALIDHSISQIKEHKKRKNNPDPKDIEQENKIKAMEAELAKKEAELNAKLAKIEALEAEEKRKKELAQQEIHKKQLEDQKKIELEKKKKEEIVISTLIPYQSKEGEKLWGYVDLKMNWVIKPKYKYVETFFDIGVAFVGVEKRRSILINKLGEELLTGFQAADWNDHYQIDSVRLPFFDTLKSQHRKYFELNYQGLIPVKLNNGKHTFIDLKSMVIHNESFDESIDIYNYNFFFTSGKEKRLMYKDGTILLKSIISWTYLGDNCFKVKENNNGVYKYYRFVEKSKSLEDIKLNFSLNQGEYITKIFKGYFEVEYKTFFYGVEDKTYLKYFKDGKLITEFVQYTKQFCIDLQGNFNVFNWGYGYQLGENMFWFDNKYKEIISLKHNKCIYSQGEVKASVQNYKTLTSCFIKCFDHNILLWIDWLSGESKEIKLKDNYDSIYEESFYFGVRKVYGDYFDYLIDQLGNIVLNEAKEAGYYTQIRPSNVPGFFFVIQSGVEFLVDESGMCHKEGKTLKEIFTNTTNSFSQKDIDPLLQIAKSGKIIESSLLDKVRSISQLDYLQLEYLNCYNKREGDREAARTLLLHLGIKIQRIKFAVKIKKATEKAKKGEVITFYAFHYGYDSKALTKGDASSYIEYTWLQHGGSIRSNDAILGYYCDLGDTSFWKRIGFFSHRNGADGITKPEIIEIKYL